MLFVPVVGWNISTGVTAWTFIGSCVGTGTTLNFGSLSAGTLAAGDMMVYIQFGQGASAPSAVTPSGFTDHVNTTFSSGGNDPRIMMSSKKADGSEGSITGMNGATVDAKVGLVFRPTGTYTSLTASTPNSQTTDGNPTLQTVDPSAETVPVVIVAMTAVVGIPPAAFSTASPAFDATIAAGPSPTDLVAGYKVYNSGWASHSIDMNDLGTGNCLASFYLKAA